MRFFQKLNFCFALSFLSLAACDQTNRQEPLFVAISPEESGLTFINQIEENDSLNVIDYPYIYNGSGVGVGDINNDGLKDLFFAGNMVENKLYLNKGKGGSAPFQFEDISEQAGININRWCTGVAMVDINADGYLDIYVSVANKFNREASRNLLFVNNQDSTFTEMAEAYGLDDDGYSTQAAFFDYDLDGDLDMYLLTNGMEPFNHNNPRPKKVNGEGISNDRLYRNEGIGPDGHPVFTDVSREAGILKEGYGLGIAISDINDDGWPDVYAANDFITNDLMWINQGNSSDSLLSFTDKAPDYLKHQTHNGMGADLADYNNDGLVDIMVLDMLPEDNQRQKSMLGKPNYDKFLMALNLGYTPQYMRNTLQLNNGKAPDGSLSFSEIGQLAGVSNTDWSWSALFADYDNDGYRDLLVTNGYVRDITDLDYIVYQSTSTQFGKADKKQQRASLISALKSAKVHNYIYRNAHDLTFSDQSEAWGLDEPSFSNGAVFADLDNDGDLDLVMNNLNDPAFLYENRSETLGHHYLTLRLEGTAQNRAGLGTKITIWYDGQQQYHYHNVYRGFKSSQDADVHFGLGKQSTIDSLQIIWPDGKSQLLFQVKANQLLTLSHADAQEQEMPQPEKPKPLLQAARQALDLHFIPQENDFVDFKYQVLLPRKYSQDGPAIATGDINGDGLDDFYVGGAKDFAGTFFIQQPNGSFREKTLDDALSSEDMGALFFDADQDGDPDLYVVSGGNEYHEKHEAYVDRLYLNDGQGNFSRATQALPTDMLSSGSCVVAADYDQDGDLDLFVGGRIRPQKYPLPPRSYLLRNDGGVFTDVTAEVAPALENIGLVTAALWTDYDNDGSADLLVAGEWMPLTFLHNEGSKFTNATAETGLSHTSGWWNSLLAGDFDHDGDTDYVAGNLGLNSKYKASEAEPLSIYAKDFDQNNTLDPVMAYYIMGEEYPAHPRDALIDQIAYMRRKFPLYEMYGEARFSDVFDKEELKDAYVLQSQRMESSYLENMGGGKFRISSLPTEVQFAPIFGMFADDVNWDGKLDILVAGNSYATEIETGHYTAGIGNVLLGDGKGNFTHASLQESGFFVDTDAKAMSSFIGQDQKLYHLISSNRDSLKVFTYTQAEADMMIIPLADHDFYAEVSLKDGSSYRHEFHYGAGFLSQSTRHFCVRTKQLEQVTIFTYQGERRIIQPATGLTQK